MLKNNTKNETISPGSQIWMISFGQEKKAYAIFWGIFRHHVVEF